MTDESGNPREDTFTMLVRDIDRGVVTEVEPMGAILEKAGVVKIKKIGAATVKLAKANDVYEITAREMKKNPSLLYQLRPEKTPSMMKLIEDLWFKRRDIVSDGYDESLEYISKIIPLRIHKIPSGTKCWTWTIPEKWSVKDAYIETAEGERLLDLKDHPLHIVSYSLPVDKIVSKAELFDHLHSKPERPDAIPFEFKYYEKDWGFCVPHNKLKNFTADSYKVFIDSEFQKGTLEVGDCTIKGKTEETIVFAAHLCHPAMANDDLAGVAVMVDVARELAKRENHFTYKFLLVSETIGSVAYLSQNEDVIKKMKCGVFLEMLGSGTKMALQLSKRGDAKIDRIARYALSKMTGDFREGPFRQIVGNDEMVFDGPGVDVPMVSISRFPYPEYHTSDDNPSIIKEAKLIEARDLVLKIIDIIESDYTPKRTFRGPVFLSGYGLWVDWKTNKEVNENIEQIMLRLEGDKSVFDIACELGIEFKDVLEYVDKFLEKGLVTKTK